jgi:hypothetical protein
VKHNGVQLEVLVSEFDRNYTTALLVYRESVLLDILAFAMVPVGNQESVSSSWETKAWLTDTQMVKALTHVATRDSQSLHTWESGSFVEEGVHESIVLLAALVHSWVGAFKDEVDMLGNRNVDSNLQLLDGLHDRVCLDPCPSMPNGSGGGSEVWWFKELGKWHEEDTIIGQLMVCLLQESWSPSTILV